VRGTKLRDVEQLPGPDAETVLLLEGIEDEEPLAAEG
jgi:hypothetical protein